MIEISLVVDDYSLAHRVGTNSFGYAVYLAKSKDKHKVFIENILSNQELYLEQRGIFKEIASLNHRNLPKIYRLVQPNQDELYIIREWYEFKTVHFLFPTANELRTLGNYSY